MLLFSDERLLFRRKTDLSKPSCFGCVSLLSFFWSKKDNIQTFYLLKYSLWMMKYPCGQRNSGCAFYQSLLYLKESSVILLPSYFSRNKYEYLLLSQDVCKIMLNKRVSRADGFFSDRGSASHCRSLDESMSLHVIRPGRRKNDPFSSGTKLRVTCPEKYVSHITGREEAEVKCQKGEWKPKKPACRPCKSPTTWFFRVMFRRGPYATPSKP